MLIFRIGGYAVDVLFENFGFRALWTPELLIPLIVIGFIYFMLIKRWQRFKDGVTRLF